MLVIDEAHLLDGVQTFEALRLLLNFEPGGKPALTLLLVGQPAVCRSWIACRNGKSNWA